MLPVSAGRHGRHGVKRALRNIGNHMEVNPKAKIVVVTHAEGVDLLMEGARTRSATRI